MVFQGVSYFFMIFGWFPWFPKVFSWFWMDFGWFPWRSKAVSGFMVLKVSVEKKPKLYQQHPTIPSDDEDDKDGDDDTIKWWWWRCKWWWWQPVWWQQLAGRLGSDPGNVGIFRKEPQGIVEPSDIIHFFLSTLGDDVSRSIITEVIVCHGQQASSKAGSSKNRHQSKPLIGSSLIINDSVPNMHGKPIIALNNQLNKWSPILSHIITQSAPFVYTFFCISQQTSSHTVLSYCCTSVTS